MGKNRSYCYEWPRPAVAVDIAMFTVAGTLNDLRLQVLLIERIESPFAGQWALPGGFVRENEDLQDAANRELEEESGVQWSALEQVAAIGTPGRDSRGHVITILYMGLTAGDRHQLQARGDSRHAAWWDIQGKESLPPLAFDHQQLLDLSLAHLRKRLPEAPILSWLLPEHFTLSEMQTLTEVILGHSIDRRNFRRKIHESGQVEPVEGTRRIGTHRPAQLFRFVLQKEIHKKNSR